MESVIEFSLGDRESRVIFVNGRVGKERKFFEGIKEELSSRGEKTLFVFDDNTYRLFGNELAESECVILNPGESSKNWDSVSLILESAVKIGLGRNGAIVGVGGGVIGDLTGFAASVYMRGCSLVLVPTTLLAMVDASIGGKTGFDFMGFKNMVGSFYPASRIYIDVDTLGSLPEREYLCGIAEVIKSAMLGDEELFSLLENGKKEILSRDRGVVGEIVKRSIMVKVKIVEEDPKESGKRAWLNLGHTFAHALEAINNFEGIKHGEAVAWGLAKAMNLGLELGITNETYAERVVRLLDSYGIVKQVIFDAKRIVRAMYGDKKLKRGKLRFVLQRNLCDNLIVEDISEQTLLKVLESDV